MVRLRSDFPFQVQKAGGAVKGKIDFLPVHDMKKRNFMLSVSQVMDGICQFMRLLQKVRN